MKRRGISLIVLSITILVMAILAATAIIALEDTGVIKRSKNTVSKQNYTEEYTRLQVIKNGILTDNLGTITVAEYVTELTNQGLIESTIVNNADGSKTVTTKSGFEVTISQSTSTDLNLSFDGVSSGTTNNNNANTTPVQLTAPTIAISANTLTITDTSGNATSYEVYVGSTLKNTTTSTTVALDTLGLTTGTHSITVKAIATGYTTSVASSAKSYTVITFTIAGTTYYTRSGSTWTEWVNSAYNTASAYISSSKVYIGSSYVTTTSSGSTAVSSTATIVSGTAYGTYTSTSTEPGAYADQ